MIKINSKTQTDIKWIVVVMAVAIALSTILGTIAGVGTFFKLTEKSLGIHELQIIVGGLMTSLAGIGITFIVVMLIIRRLEDER